MEAATSASKDETPEIVEEKSAEEVKENVEENRDIEKEVSLEDVKEMVNGDEEKIENDGGVGVKIEEIGDNPILQNEEGQQQTPNEEEPDAKKKNETPDVLCLQLDEGDNLDVYFEKERARKKELEMNKMLKEEEKINNQEQNEKSPPPSNKSKVSKKKTIKIAQKKVKSKIVENIKNQDQPENSDNLKSIGVDSKESVEENKEENLIQQPEVLVKSMVIKCDKKDDNKENRFLWVSNINRYTKANDLKVHFTPHGKVQTARIVTDGKNYYGYLLMEKKEDVENCIENLQGTIFDGIKIHLSEKKPEQKSKNENGEKTDRKIEPRRKSSSIKNDPLTLKVKDYESEELNKKYEKEIILRKKQSEEERRREIMRRNREAERIREERRKERIKYEERKAQEMKIEREKRKLEHERHLIEKEKMNLLRLQKRLADTERSLIQRQKQDLERDIKNLEYKKRKSESTFERKPTKMTRIDEKYWKKESSSKSYDDTNYKKVDTILVPPPPVLSENYHQKSGGGDKDRNWKEISKDNNPIETRYSYGDRNDYERYQKDRRSSKEKNYHWEEGYNNSSTANSWRNVNRHSVSSFPVTGNVYQAQSSNPTYYQGYRKSTNDYYYRGSDRKY